MHNALGSSLNGAQNEYIRTVAYQHLPKIKNVLKPEIKSINNENKIKLGLNKKLFYIHELTLNTSHKVLINLCHGLYFYRTINQMFVAVIHISTLSYV